MSAVPKTTIDWFRFRTRAQVPEVIEALRPLFGFLGKHLHTRHLPHGTMGFKQACSIVLLDVVVGRMDYGGESQREWVRVELFGKGCEWVTNWDDIDLVETLAACELRRSDLALTTWQNEVTHDQLVYAHGAGRFVTSGRPPKLRQIVSSDPKDGRTCYVGERKNAAKMLRGYERGLKIASEAPNAMLVTHIDGHVVEGIYRVEVELKAQDDPIPWEVIDRRDQYFAGSYPFCADILPGVQADILMRRPERAPQLDLDFALANCRIQYGQTLYTALRAYGGDIGAVWDRIVGDHHNKAMVEAGVLMVEHD